MPQWQPKERPPVPCPFTVSKIDLPIDIELAQHSHVGEMLRIEHEAFGIHAWDGDQFHRCIARRPFCCLLAIAVQRIVGFAVYEIQRSGFELMSLAVDKRFRRLDVGSQLIWKIQGYAVASPKRKRIVTVVRERNLAAQLFFKSRGFRAMSFTDDYYSDCEDAGIGFQWRAPRVLS